MNINNYINQWAQLINESEDYDTDTLENPTELIKFIESYPNFNDCMFKDSDGWNVTTEWLVGTFAGRSFYGKTKEDAALQLIEYLNRHIGHKSIVGDCVKNSGWPNKHSVKRYIDSAFEDQDTEGPEN